MMSDKKLDTQGTLVTHSFPDRESAERAYEGIRARGYESDEIHVIMSHDTKKRLSEKDAIKIEKGNKSLEGAGVGGALGGAVGATLLGVMAAGASLAIPGLPLIIAGPIAGALAGGAAGAAAGGVLGALVGLGIPEDRAKAYEADLKKGGIVLGVRPRDDKDARYFEDEWQGHRAL
jgi:hypothetical protein